MSQFSIKKFTYFIEHLESFNLAISKLDQSNIKRSVLYIMPLLEKPDSFSIIEIKMSYITELVSQSMDKNEISSSFMQATYLKHYEIALLHFMIYTLQINHIDIKLCKNNIK